MVLKPPPGDIIEWYSDVFLGGTWSCGTGNLICCISEGRVKENSYLEIDGTKTLGKK